MRFHPITPAAALVIAMLAPALPRAERERPPDHDVKAALLFNFLKFVDWGAGSGPLEVCVVGETRVLEAANALQGRTVAGRAVTVRRAVSGELRTCRAAFLAPTEDPRLEELIEQLARAGSLVVGDGPEFAARGAHLNFYVMDDHVRFEANVRAIRRDRIQVSSKLLRLARIVDGS